MNQRRSPGEPERDAAAEAFRLFFERSTDPMWLLDPQAGAFISCNNEAVRLLRANSPAQLLGAQPSDLSPPLQPNGRSSAECQREIIRRVEATGGDRFEWMARRLDGSLVTVEVSMTRLVLGGRVLHAVVSRDISERKQQEQALRDTQRLLTSITDHLHAAIYRTGPNHELVFANPAYLRLFGYDSFEELRRLPRERLYANPDDRVPLLETLARVGQFQNVEIHFVRRDGTRFWGLISSVAIRDPRSGSVAYHVGSIADITERKLADDEIRRLNASLERRVSERTAELASSEERLRTLVEHAPEAIVLFDGDTGCFLNVNENAVRLYGLAREVLLQLGPWDVSPEFQPDGRRSTEAARQWIEQALAGDRPAFNWTHRHSSGRLIPCEVRLVRLPAGARRLVRGSVLDNTERHHRERVQQATYAISQAVLEAHDLTSLYGRIHDIIRGLLSAQNFYIALLDPATEMISFPYFVDEFSPLPEPRKVTTGLTGEVLRTGRPLLVTGTMQDRKRRVGEAVVIEGVTELPYVESGPPAAVWLGVPLRVQGRVLGVMAVQDYENEAAFGAAEQQVMTFVAEQIGLAIERKRAEEEVLRALAREKELNRLKSDFVSMVSHEFRTPLGIIQSSADILNDYLDRLDPAERREHLDSITKNTRRIAGLMEEVLVLGRIEAGKMSFQPAALSLAALCGRIAEEVQASSRQRCPIELSVSELPAEARADEGLLRHILVNLLSNAVKYSEAGSSVHFDVHQEGPRAVFVIADHGIGIPPADQAYLFQAFHRGANVGQRPGSGLGLVIVKRCVDLHQGTIEVQSEPSAGTTVTVQLPVFYDPATGKVDEK